MRTTLSIDDDVAALLEQEMKQSGEPFKVTVNRVMRLGLMATKKGQSAKPFVVTPFDLTLPDGMSFENVEELLDALEGPGRR